MNYSPKDKLKMIDLKHEELSVREQCKLLGVSRSGLYYQPSPRTFSEAQIQLLHKVDEIYTAYPFFGTRKMSDYLKLNGYPHIERHHIRWAYEYIGLQSVAPGPHTSIPHPEHKIYPYLLRNYIISKPNEVWSTDITYLRLDQGFVYLVAIIDWYSRYVLDWEISITMEAEFCIDTLSRVLKNAKCSIFNTDQGSQFTSNAFTGVLKEHDIQISMDGRGRALDNIFVERLWRSVKYECVYLKEWRTVADIRHGIAEYFEFYNNKRPHQSLGGITPYSVHYNDNNKMQQTEQILTSEKFQIIS